MSRREEALVDAVAQLVCSAFIWHDENGERRVDVAAGVFDRLEMALGAYEEEGIREGAAA